MSQKGPLTQQRILIVDDNAIIRSLLRLILRNGGYEVVGEAGNGVVALELAERLRPDIVCLDVEMPEMGGLEALRVIIEKYPAMVVVMITGHSSADNVHEAQHSGACGFIIKPFKAGKVLDTLEKAWQSAGRFRR